MVVESFLTTVNKFLSLEIFWHYSNIEFIYICHSCKLLKLSSNFKVPFQISESQFVRKHFEKSVFQVIQARKACHQPAYTEYSENVNVDDGIFLRGYEINKCSYFHANFPNVDHAGASFIYETTCSNDSTFDFSGGSMTRSYSRVDPLESFESVETLCLDDFC